MRSVRELSQAFALAVPHEDAVRIRDDVALLPGGAVGVGQARGGRVRARKRSWIMPFARSSPARWRRKG